MSITVEATYENGVLRPVEPLDLNEHQRIVITIHEPGEVPRPPAQRGYGLLRWTGSIDDLDYLIDDPANDPLERP